MAFGQNHSHTTEIQALSTDTIYSSPNIDGLSFLKVRRGNKEVIFISISLQSTTVVEGPLGANILLNNGKAINRSGASITVKPIQNSNHYIYSSLVELSENDIAMLRTCEVFRFRLYLYYNDVKHGQKLREEFTKLLARS
jgi:hypothetical protein